MNFIEQLTSFVGADDPYDYRLSDVRELQLAAAHQRFERARGAMPVLDRRASDCGIEKITQVRDLVPLMFSDATYKSYPDSFIAQRKWNALGAWLDALSTSAGAAQLNYDGVTDIDGWIARLADHGHTVYVSSGTSGRCSIFQVSQADREMDVRGFRSAWRWKAGVQPDRSRPVFALMPRSGAHRMMDTFGIVVRDFGRPDATYFLSDTPLLVSEVNRMARLSKDIAAGTATPGDIHAAELAVAAKQAASREAMRRMGEAVTRHRDEPSFFVGTWAPMFALAQAAKTSGLVGGLHPDTLFQTGGGLKGAVLPNDYREQIESILGLKPARNLSLYGMTELTPFMPQCAAGHYHLPPWHVALVLDKSGEQLLAPEDGRVSGRLAFFDVSMDGHWGALVSGDHGTLQLTPCACGRRGPSLLHDIVRYRDLPGGDDKVSCAGTIDTYVRGVIGGETL
ncbi:MAG: hypothetical protein JWQ90_2485 [Hydrocarboniphaga sp.]|uniref:hypothetical protein n=1 Tax=Hydrocarboniphaga sp. TaxID=2033016 RepID=UPI002608501A|nr:hypothetical protein [Hydrocarboniphaga sp.]MDB5970035.1 hypothetical protein [Hydrocarboniphaga sp.]